MENKKGIIHGSILKEGTVSASKLDKESVKEYLEKLITEDEDIFNFMVGVIDKIKNS